MNKCFIDTKQKSVIKIVRNSFVAEREIVGAKIFSQFAIVPTVERLDTKTLKISLVQGVRPSEEKKGELNSLLVKLFEQINKAPLKSSNLPFSVFKDIEELREIFSQNPEILKILSDVTTLFSGIRLFPVHGDLQKQNILISNKKLVLFDFEHFTFGPQELDLVNSLFFNDTNCLALEKLIPILIEKNIVSPKLLEASLELLAVKELALDRPQEDVEIRSREGWQKLVKITKIKLALPSLRIKRNGNENWTASTCFA